MIFDFFEIRESVEGFGDGRDQLVVVDVESVIMVNVISRVLLPRLILSVAYCDHTFNNLPKNTIILKIIGVVILRLM